jgi:hypothetical protein
MCSFKRTVGVMFLVVLFLPCFCWAQGRETTPAQSKLLAERAAIVDGQRNLIELIYGLTLASGTTVKDFIVDKDTIRSNLDNFLKGAKQIGKTVFLPDGTAEVMMEVNVQGINGVIGKEVQYYEKTITVAGHGSPPPPKPKPKFAEKDTVKWYEQVVKVTGKGAPPKDAQNQSQAKLMAERAAKMDAYRNLLEQVRGTKVDAKTKVEDFETQYDIIKTNLEAYLKGARVVDVRHLEDGTAEVDIEYNLRNLKNLFESVW